jgi:hypothetical protein
MGATITSNKVDEARIREHVQQAFARANGVGPKGPGPDESSNAAIKGAIAWEDAWVEVSQVAESFWNLFDLRESEEARLSQLMGEAVEDIRNEVRPRLIAALERAAITFAEDYPDAPLAVADAQR